MNASSPSTLSLSEADRLLKRFDCLTSVPQDWDPAQIQAALRLVADYSDYQMLGICADSLAQAQAVLQAYASALGYDPDGSVAPVEGPVYLKFNPRSGRCYADTYSGEHRGVLVSCQSADIDGVNQMYGHLPLNLYAPI